MANHFNAAYTETGTGRPDESNHKSRNWIFTLNNPTELEYAKILSYMSDAAIYGIIGKETGKTGIPHLQCYIQMKTPYGGQTLKNKMCKRLWMGVANSAVKSRDYCMKDGDYTEVGEFRDHEALKKAGVAKGSAKGGAQTQAMWQSLNKMVNDGKGESEICDAFPQLYYKHHSGVSRAITIKNKIPIRTEKTCVHVIIGPPGVGKTTKAHEIAGLNGFFYSSPNKIWWSGYDGQSAVVFDDFHGNYPFDDFKKVTDKYPHRVPVHNGMINFNPKLIVVTSNLHPTEWWRQEVLGTHGIAALYRRINVLQIWNQEKEMFETHLLMDDTNTRSLWDSGCLCTHDSQLAGSRDPTLEILDSEDEEPPQVLDEELVIPETQLDLQGKRPSSSSLPPPKKRKTFPKIPVKPKAGGKTVPSLHTDSVSDSLGADYDTFEDSDDMKELFSEESISESF